MAARAQVMVVHRGETEPPDLVDVQHLHVARPISRACGAARQLQPDAVLDAIALTRADAETAVAALPEQARLVVLSSIDVYRAYSGLMKRWTPIACRSTRLARALRTLLRTAKGGGTPRTTKSWTSRRSTAHAAGSRFGCRWSTAPSTASGARSSSCVGCALARAHPVRRRDVADVPGYVGDIAAGIRLALENPNVAGEVFNLAERADGVDAPVGGARLPSGRRPGRAGPRSGRRGYLRTCAHRPVTQHLLADAAKARRVLGWSHGDPLGGLRQVGSMAPGPPAHRARPRLRGRRPRARSSRVDLAGCRVRRARVESQVVAGRVRQRLGLCISDFASDCGRTAADATSARNPCWENVQRRDMAAAYTAPTAVAMIRTLYAGEQRLWMRWHTP